MINWVAPVNPSHPYFENDRLRPLTPTICAFHLGFSLVRPLYSSAGTHKTARLLEGNYLRTTYVGIASRSAGKHYNLALFARRRNGSAHTLETLGVAPA